MTSLGVDERGWSGEQSPERSVGVWEGVPGVIVFGWMAKMVECELMVPSKTKPINAPNRQPLHKPVSGRPSSDPLAGRQSLDP